MRTRSLFRSPIILGSLLATFVLLAAACGTAATGTPTPTATPTPTSEPAAEVSEQPTSNPVSMQPNDNPTPSNGPSSVAPGGPNPNPLQVTAPTPALDVPVTLGLVEIVPEVVEQVAPSVVAVAARVQRPGRGEGTSTGTGVIFDDRGYILTNNHVVQGASEVQITLFNDRSLPAEIVGTDPSTDLAVLKVEPGTDIRAVPLGDATKLRVGEFVIAIGHALGLRGSPTVTVGVVSALGRSLPVSQNVALFDLIQTDALINPGNSGGPLLNLDGEVVGINTAILRGPVGGGQEAEGIGFAIPTDTAEPIARQLIEFGRAVTPVFGIFIDDVNPAKAFEMGLPVERGVLITDVASGGGADEAGIEPGDIMVAVDGEPVDSVRQLRRILRMGYRADMEVEVTVVRGDKTLNFSVVLQERSG